MDISLNMNFFLHSTKKNYLFFKITNFLKQRNDLLAPSLNVAESIRYILGSSVITTPHMLYLTGVVSEYYITLKHFR